MWKHRDDSKAHKTPLPNRNNQRNLPSTMKLSLLPTTTIVLVLSLLESAASSPNSNLHRIRSSSADVAATTYTHIPNWQRRSLLIDEMPSAGLEAFDVLLLGGSSMSMSFSISYNDASVVGNDDLDSTGTTTTTTTTNEVVDEATGEIVVIHHEDHPSTVTTTPSTTTINTQAIHPPTTTIHETFANIPTSTTTATSASNRSLLPLISIAGGLLAIGAIIGGVYRNKKQKKTSNSNNNNGGGIIHLDEKSIQSINSKSTDEMSSSLADEENNDSRLTSTTSSLASMAAMSTLVSSSGRVDRRSSI